MEQELIALIRDAKAVAPEVFDMMVRHHTIMGWVTVLSNAVTLPLAVLSVWYGFRTDWNGPESVVYVMLTSLGACTSLVGSVAYGIPAMLNPAYFAIKDLIPCG